MKIDFWTTVKKDSSLEREYLKKIINTDIIPRKEASVMLDEDGIEFEVKEILIDYSSEEITIILEDYILFDEDFEEIVTKMKELGWIGD